MVEGITQLNRRLRAAGSDLSQMSELMHRVGTIVIQNAHPPRDTSALARTLPAGPTTTKKTTPTPNKQHPPKPPWAPPPRPPAPRPPRATFSPRRSPPLPHPGDPGDHPRDRHHYAHQPPHLKTKETQNGVDPAGDLDRKNT